MNSCHLRLPAFRILKVIASLLSPTAFALGSINFADYERAHVGLRWSNIWRVSFCDNALNITNLTFFFAFLPQIEYIYLSGIIWSELFGMSSDDDT